MNTWYKFSSWKGYNPSFLSMSCWSRTNWCMQAFTSRTFNMYWRSLIRLNYFTALSIIRGVAQYMREFQEQIQPSNGKCPQKGKKPDHMTPFAMDKSGKPDMKKESVITIDLLKNIIVQNNVDSSLLINWNCNLNVYVLDHDYFNSIVFISQLYC